MTVKEYREKYPNCKYCKYWLLGYSYGYECSAIKKRMYKRTAKKCPCYVADTTQYEDYKEQK